MLSKFFVGGSWKPTKNQKENSAMTFGKFLMLIYTHGVPAMLGVAIAALATALILSMRRNKKLRAENHNLHGERAKQGLHDKIIQATLLGDFVAFFRSQATNLQVGPLALNEAQALMRLIEKMESLVNQLGFDQAFFDRLAQELTTVMPGIAALRDGLLRDTKAQLVGVTRLLSSERRTVETSAPPTSIYQVAGASPTRTEPENVLDELFPQEKAPTSSQRGGRIRPVFDELNGHDAETTMFTVEEDAPTGTAHPKPASVPPKPAEHNGLLAVKSLQVNGAYRGVTGNSNTVDTSPGTPEAKLRSSVPPPKGKPVARVSSPPPATMREGGRLPPPALPPQRGKAGSGTRTAVQVPRVPTQVGVGNRVG
jgi:hypothetical protein